MVDRRVLALFQTVRRDAVLGVLLATATLCTGIALIAAATYLIARAAQVTMFVDVAVLVVTVRGLAIGRAALRYAERYVTHRTSLGLLARLRAATFQALEERLPGLYGSLSAGDLLARLGPDIDAIDRVYLGVIVPASAAFVGGSIAIIGLGLVSPDLGLVLAIGLGVGGLAVPIISRRLTEASSRRTIHERGRLQAAAVDDLAGTAELIAFEVSTGFDDRVGRASAELRATESRLGWWRGAANALASSVGAATALVVLVMAIPLVTSGAMDVTLLAVLPLVTIVAFEGVQPLASAMDQSATSGAAADRVFGIMASPLPVVEPTAPRSLPARGSLVAEDLAFRYGPALPWVFDGLDLAVPAGGRLAISGPSGAGKSTIVDLLVRFRQADRGRILLGDVDLAEASGEDVRSRMAVVPQRPYLFHGTIRDNLLVADGAASDEKILEALHWAALDDLLASTTAGLDAMVGEQGLRLSGGERQRLALARMWLKDAPIVILDEATAHLDGSTEAVMVRRLDAYLEGRTAIILAHRSALLELADLRLELRATRLGAD